MKETIGRLLGRGWVWFRGLKLWIQILAVLVLISVISAPFTEDDTATDTTFAFENEDDEPAEPEPEPGEAQYRAKVENYYPVNPASLRVVVKVTNYGDAAGVPDCTVRGRDESYSYSGFDIFTLRDPVQPGKYTRFNGVITIENEGAEFVTQVTAKCEPS